MIDWIYAHDAIVVSIATYLGFSIELLIAEWMFSLGFQKEKPFILRAVLSITVYLIAIGSISVLLPLVSKNTLSAHLLFEIATYLGIVLLSIAVLRCCFHENMTELLFCAVTGYAVQHLYAQISLLFYSICDTEVIQYIWYPISRLMLLVVYFVVYRIVVKKSDGKREIGIKNRNIYRLSYYTIGMVLVLSAVRDYYRSESFALTIVTRLFSVTCCVFLLLIRGGYLNQSRMELEMETIRQLNHKEREQYLQNKQNIKLINIKCHDLKKRLEQYEDRMIGLTQQEIDEIKEAVAIYDTTVRTGNEILDTILTERSLVCEKNNIIFSSIADGEALSFLSTGDLYSLFANAIDNAIEAVSRLSKTDQRIISLTVRKKMGMVSILIDNYYDRADLVFDRGLPKTTKENEQYHGYGMKSIRMIVDKYDGQMNIVTDDMFHLSILLPIP